jgi:hypothetical protein
MRTLQGNVKQHKIVKREVNPLARMKDFIEKQKKRSRMEILKSWMSSFAVTVSVVVVAVVLIPKSASATLTRVEPFANEVFYQVEVTDSDNAIASGSLMVVLENQLEEIKTSLDLGVTSGYFSELKANTTYDLCIKADKGFGLETLDSVTFKTKSRVGGAFRAETLVSSPEEWNLTYEVGVFLSDPEAEFQAIVCRYGILYLGEEEPTQYETVELDLSQTSLILPMIPNGNVQVVLILEGTRWDDEVVVLDRLTFFTPFHLETSFGLSWIDARKLAVYLYPDMYFLSDVTYQLVLKKGDRVIETKETAFVSDEFSHHESQEIVFAGLLPDTEYTVELIAKYTHPQWLSTQETLLSSVTESTLADYQYSVSVVETDTTYNVSITLTDPMHNFQLGFYIVTVMDPMGEYQIASGDNGFTPSGEQKSTTLVIQKVDDDDVRIDIGVRSQTVYYHQSILKTIKP